MRKQSIPVFILLACFVALSVFGAPTAALAAERKPLLQQGKKTLFQRVVTHPGAKLYENGQSGAKVIQDQIKTFSVFYVYDRKNGYVEVGPSSNQPIGWMEVSALTDWPQAMTLLFTERTGRMPVLFFKEQTAIKTICEADDLKVRIKKLESDVQAARTSSAPVTDLPVLASEPPDKEGAIARSRFYLMPVQDMTEPFEGTKFLKVASIDPGSGNAPPAGSDGAGANGANGNNNKPATMRTGIVFVMDTTISMKPYIEQSLNIIRSAFDDIEKNKLGESVGFAVIAFRNSTEKNTKVEYTTRKVSDFKTLKDRKELEDALAKVEEAGVSTHSFNEDSAAGIKAAVDELDWQNYQSRIIVLITDAGPLKPGDTLASTRMAPAELLDYAKAKKIWVTVTHIRSPAGAKDHAYAEKAYRDLTRTSSGASSYMPIPAPDPKTGAANFAKTTKALTDSLTKVVKATASRTAPQKPHTLAESPKPLTPEEEGRRVGEMLGYAMQLEFIGTRRGNRAPSLVQAWIADMDLAELADGRYAPAVEVAVLLTKNQLSDLQRTLQVIVDQAERTKKTDSRDFFQSVISASAALARDPAAFSSKPGQNLQQTGVLGEFLEGLPYKSDVMLLTEEDWYRMSVGEQTAFINRLRSRIARYEEYDKDDSNWESFGAKNSGDWICRIPLRILP